MPRNIDRNDRPALVRAAKIWADGLVRWGNGACPRSKAIEIVAKKFGYPDWNRLVADAPRLEFEPIKDGHPRKPHGNIIATGTGDEGIMAMAASIIRAHEISPELRFSVIMVNNPKTLSPEFGFASNSPSKGFVSILRCPGLGESVPGWMGDAWASAANVGLVDKLSFAVRVRDGKAEAFGPDLAAHNYVLNSLPGKPCSNVPGGV